MKTILNPLHQVLASLFLLSSVQMLPAQPAQWQADPTHSYIGFSVKHLMISNVEGKFAESTVLLTQGKPDFAGSQVEVVLPVRSINTGVDDRDKHLRSADFFDAEKYPDIRFVSKSFVKTGANKYRLSGLLTIHGVTKPVSFAATYNGQAKDPWGNTRAAFAGNTRINRYDYGLKYNSALETGGVLIGETVDVIFKLEFIKQENTAKQANTAGVGR